MKRFVGLIVTIFLFHSFYSQSNDKLHTIQLLKTSPLDSFISNSSTDYFLNSKIAQADCILFFVCGTSNIFPSASKELNRLSMLRFSIIYSSNAAQVSDIMKQKIKNNIQTNLNRLSRYNSYKRYNLSFNEIESRQSKIDTLHQLQFQNIKIDSFLNNSVLGKDGAFVVYIKNKEIFAIDTKFCFGEIDPQIYNRSPQPSISNNYDYSFYAENDTLFVHKKLTSNNNTEVELKQVYKNHYLIFKKCNNCNFTSTILYTYIDEELKNFIPEYEVNQIKEFETYKEIFELIINQYL
jgi:hypothetical protein